MSLFREVKVSIEDLCLSIKRGLEHISMVLNPARHNTKEVECRLGFYQWMRRKRNIDQGFTNGGGGRGLYRLCFLGGEGGGVGLHLYLGVGVPGNVL